MLTIFLQKKINLVKVEIWSDKEFVRQTLGEDLLRQGYVRKTDESLTNRLVVFLRSGGQGFPGFPQKKNPRAFPASSAEPTTSLQKQERLLQHRAIASTSTQPPHSETATPPSRAQPTPRCQPKSQASPSQTHLNSGFHTHHPPTNPQTHKHSFGKPGVPGDSKTPPSTRASHPAKISLLNPNSKQTLHHHIQHQNHNLFNRTTTNPQHQCTYLELPKPTPTPTPTRS
jgi:hypothetical protein